MAPDVQFLDGLVLGAGQKENITWRTAVRLFRIEIGLPARVISWPLAVALLLAGPPPGFAAPAPPGYDALPRLMAPDPALRRQAADHLLREADRSLVPGLVDALFFTPRQHRAELVRVLEGLTGERLGAAYHPWVRWVGQHPEVTPRRGYGAWKASLFERIDPGYRKILGREQPVRIRLEEVVSGGVPLDGIPALDEPAMIPAAEASYLEPGERVFGVALDGEARAYPLRILSWHEMLNDRVAGQPVTLSFCSLCGSGLLFSSLAADGAPLSFATSGLLYRSNKLMFDRQTQTLWSNLTGEAVVGPLARGPERLRLLPMTLTTWDAWRQRHPDTLVIALEPLLRRFPFRYLPGAADRAREGVAFPVPAASDRLPREEEVYALRLAGAAKAYPVRRILAEGIVHDTVGGTGIVLVGDPGSGEVRAYANDGLRFRRAPGSELLIDEGGGRWRLDEAALLPEGPEARSPLTRVPGHVAFWFGWYAFFPDSEVYAGPGS